MCSAVCVRLFFISLFIIDLELDGTLLMVVIREDMVDNQNQKKMDVSFVIFVSTFMTCYSD